MGATVRCNTFQSVHGLRLSPESRPRNIARIAVSQGVSGPWSKRHKIAQCPLLNSHRPPCGRTLYFSEHFMCPSRNQFRTINGTSVKVKRLATVSATEANPTETQPLQEVS